MEFKRWLSESSDGIDKVLAEIQEKFPFAEVSAYESKYKIELTAIKLPSDRRGAGIGTEIIRAIQNYAVSVGKPIVINPEAEKGRKSDLDRFYKSLGFVANKGKNVDFALSSPLAKTMYWRPGT